MTTVCHILQPLNLNKVLSNYKFPCGCINFQHNFFVKFSINKFENDKMLCISIKPEKGIKCNPMKPLGKGK